MKASTVHTYTYICTNRDILLSVCAYASMHLCMMYVRMWVGSEQHQNLYSCASTASTELSPAIFPLAVIMRVFNTSSGVVRAAAKEPATMPTSRFSKGLQKITVIIALRMHCVCMIDIYI